MTLPEKPSRFRLPSSIRLLVAPGIRGHALIFGFIMTFLFATALAGRSIGAGEAWTAIFAVGAAACGTYLILAPLAFLERARNLFFYSPLKKRVPLLGVIFGPLLAGVAYWINAAGSVEALPIFPAFILVFYGWILLQAYFIATPVSHLLTRVEVGISGKGHVKRTMRGLGSGVLFLSIAPLVYGVWMASNWLSTNYQSVQGSGGSIIAWTVVVMVVLFLTYFLIVQWGWKAIRLNRPQAGVFVGGTFLVFWGYLLYRATVMEIGLITQNQPSNALLDSALMVVSIIGAMQTFARKTIDRADKRWSLVVPFLVFAFGCVYAVTQFYFVLQFAITRLELSIVVNGIVFAVGVLTMMLLIRNHLRHPMAGMASPATLSKPAVESSGTSSPRSSMFRLPWRRPKNSSPPAIEELEESSTVRSGSQNASAKQDDESSDGPVSKEETADSG